MPYSRNFRELKKISLRLFLAHEKVLVTLTNSNIFSKIVVSFRKLKIMRTVADIVILQIMPIQTEIQIGKKNLCDVT